MVYCVHILNWGHFWPPPRDNPKKCHPINANNITRNIFNWMHFSQTCGEFNPSVQKLWIIDGTYNVVLYTPKTCQLHARQCQRRWQYNKNRLTDWRIDQLTSWTIYWLNNWTMELLNYWPIELLDDWPIDRFANWPIDWLTSYYQGITIINYPQWGVGWTVWAKSTCMTSKSQCNHCYGSSTWSKWLKGTDITPK